MSLEVVTRLLKQPESIHLEFKKAGSDLPLILFESVCAMLNREGGDILLGVADDGTVIGVDPTRVDVLITNLVNLSNNQEKLDPPFILSPRVYEIEGKSVIHLQVPASSQVHKTVNHVYDRSNDGDFRITQPNRIAELYMRKQTHYSENRIYPNLHFEDFKQDLFPKIRNLIRGKTPGHPWLNLSDEQMLLKAGLWRRDPYQKLEGYTLAAALLLGKDETILSIVPHYKIDALVRRVNYDRYDDRDYIEVNLIEAYERLMDFVAKHLPDRFYIDGDQRKSLRSFVFHEVITNLLVHREYTNGLPATFVIYKDRIETSNANIPHGEGLIQPENFVPFPKNPVIAKFFKQIGRADELGSGVLNVNKYLPLYIPGSEPKFIEGNTFKMAIPLPANFFIGGQGGAVVEGNTINDTVNDTVSDTVSDIVKSRMGQIISILLKEPGLRTNELANKTGVSEITIRRDMQKMQKAGLLIFIGIPKTGGYYLTDFLKSKLLTQK